ncbi:hypothetical protein ABZ499_03070 [Streptomyces sp. NPDC019990]|uniref:hypothetical protein n=1 Tax=Streptomyces sp. NPDC019990 TaxID=3154693 RepID=UPI0033C417EF
MALAAQVAVGLQFAQGGGDPGGTLGKPGGEGLDVGWGTLRQRLEVRAEPDGEERELPVLGQVIADHRETVGVAGVVVLEAADVLGRARPPLRVLVARNAGRGVRGHARVLGTHREGLIFLGGQALALGLPSRRGPSHVCGCVVRCAERRASAVAKSSRCGDVHPPE